MRAAVLALAVAALIPAGATWAEAELWDLIVDPSVGGEIAYGGNFTISGTVTDHAGHPEPSTVQVWVGSHSVEAAAGSDGRFDAEVTKSKLLPGVHVAQIRASSADDRIGMASMEIKVEGEVRPSDYLARMLAGEQAMRYLRANATDFDGDPLGAKLYSYYQDLQEKLVVQRSIESDAEERRQEMLQRQLEAGDLLRKALEENEDDRFRYDEHAHRVFIDNIDDSVRDTFVAQFEYTLDLHREARDAMRQALERGATMDEAMSVYKEHSGTSREAMERIVDQRAEIETEADPESPPGVDQGTDSTPVPTNATATAPPQDEPAEAESADVTVVYLNIDGVMTKHIFDGTRLIRAE